METADSDSDIETAVGQSPSVVHVYLQEVLFEVGIDSENGKSSLAGAHEVHLAKQDSSGRYCC
jgi:hypothetical protein